MGVLSFLRKLFGRESVAEHRRDSELTVEQEIEIDFPGREVPVDEGINFPARFNGRTVTCRITYESLQDRYHILNEEFINGFHAHRDEINNLARLLIEKDPTKDLYVIKKQDP